MSCSDSSGMSGRRSDTPSNATRIAPAVNAVLPPRWSFGARSSTTTREPFSSAEIAAHNAALPHPTMTTGALLGTVGSSDGHELLLGHLLDGVPRAFSTHPAGLHP